MTNTAASLSPAMARVIAKAGRDRKRRAWDVPMRTADALERRGLVTITWRLIGGLYATDVTLTDAGRAALDDLRNSKG